jgi:DNA-binding IclR family transcriptional regulator
MFTSMSLVHPLEQQSGSAVKSAVRVLDILELLAVVRLPLGVSEVARRLEMPKSSAHMLLATLEARGYVIGDPLRRFTLHPLISGGPRAWVGGFKGPLLRVARPLMEQLVQRTGESAVLGHLRDAHSIEYIDKVVSSDALRVDPELGRPRPVHSTSSGQVLLAHAQEPTVQACLARLEETIGSAGVQALRQTLVQVRARGFAMISDPGTGYAFGVAAPIRDGSGEVIAALNVSAPAARFHAASERVIRDLVAAASAISDGLARYASQAAGVDGLASAQPSPRRAPRRRTTPGAAAPQETTAHE